MREVYILNKNRDELTVWRTLNGILPDGSQGKIDAERQFGSNCLASGTPLPLS